MIIYTVIKLEKYKEDFFELKIDQHPSNCWTRFNFSPFLVASHQTIIIKRLKTFYDTLENQ